MMALQSADFLLSSRKVWPSIDSPFRLAAWGGRLIDGGWI
jgi:hypothetical protein